MRQDAVSVALLGEVEAALSALAPEEERALRVRFALGLPSDTDGEVEGGASVQLEARALMNLRSGSLAGRGAALPRSRRPGCGPRVSRPGGAVRQQPADSGGRGNASPPRPEPAPEPPPYDVTGWDEV